MKLSNPSCGIKAACLSATLAVLFGAGVTVVAAQAPGTDQVRLNVTGMAVPTTKILAVGRWTSKATAPGVRSLLPAEVGDTVRAWAALRLAGRSRHFVLADCCWSGSGRRWSSGDPRRRRWTAISYGVIYNRSKILQHCRVEPC
jgi:hypothetical protein